jgi:glycerol-3-phosphate dehydrogenase
VRPLAVQGAGGATDWMQLSRKHVIETDRERAHVSVFGGKLTDCLNVGEELCAEIRGLGITLSDPKKRWYGEPGDDVKDRFFAEARAMNLDGMTSASSSEKLSTRLWRRYGEQAFRLLESIRHDRQMADVLIERAEYLRCEIAHAAEREMITTLDDFLRRRSKIALVIRREHLRDAPGLREACRLLFGAEADARHDEYFAAEAAPPVELDVAVSA